MGLEYKCICGRMFDNDVEINRHHALECSARLKEEKKSNHDPVHNPAHYTQGGIQTWDYMQAKMSPEAFEGYLVGNVIKYMSRYSMKNGLQDLEKAQQYLTRLIEVYRRFKV